MSTEINLQQLAGLKPEVLPFLDKQTNTFSYIVRDPDSQACAVIDSVLNFDYPSGTASYEGADAIIRHIRDNDLQLEWLIETHAHADHLSAAPYIRNALGGRIAIGEHIDKVQETFAKLFNTGSDFAHDGSQFDHLFKDNEVYRIGNLNCLALYTPGHTPACMTHLIGDAAFVGDTIFMPDSGTARADFPGGDARILYRSIKKILSLPASTRLFMCHDYSENRELEYETTVGEEVTNNIHVNSGIDEDTFVKMREDRDRGLAVPNLILPSLQVNMRAGNFPDAEDNGRVYLKLPINAFVS
ncbi:MAG: MBL fold metallo-hydrolase [Gammaproteobacteria bacterium]|nr:MBL fold metallo-hydrolase [Pseudomonadales bacterium]MCP5347920.1 MBL fold metallo-hydrolase [Pseudomonadales bacterium]